MTAYQNTTIETFQLNDLPCEVDRLRKVLLCEGIAIVGAANTMYILQPDPILFADVIKGAREGCLAILTAVAAFENAAAL